MLPPAGFISASAIVHLSEPVQLVVTEPAVVVVVVLPAADIPLAPKPHRAVTGGVPFGVWTEAESNASTPRTHEFAFAVVIDKVGVLDVVVAPVFVVGNGLVWSTPDREIAPPAVPSVPTVPLRVTAIVYEPDGGFKRYQMDAFSWPVPPAPTFFVKDTPL
jgi:hypothetical protein